MTELRKEGFEVLIRNNPALTSNNTILTAKYSSLSSFCERVDESSILLNNIIYFELYTCHLLQ
jgi:hypothetical protein